MQAGESVEHRRNHPDETIPSPYQASACNFVVHQDASPASFSVGTNDGSLSAISPSTLASSVRQYFTAFYPLPSYAFLHPSSTWQLCQEGRLNQLLAYAIHGLVSLSVTAAHEYDDGVSPWIDHVERDILAKLDSVTTSRLQALLLVTNYHMETGRLQKAFMLVAIATRFATAMRLNHEHAGLNPVQREVRRRILWSLKLMERYFSIGLLEFELCPFEAIYLEFLANEEDFCGAETVLCHGHNNDYGSYRLSIQLEIVRRDIMKFSRCIALGDGGIDLFRELSRSFEEELAQLGAQMTPLDLNGSDGEDCMQNAWLTRRVFLQLSFHQCHCDVSRLMLTGYHEAAPAEILQGIDQETTVKAEERCWTNAMAIIRLMTTLNNQSTKSLIFEFDTAICIYHAIRIILFIASEGINSERVSYEFAVSRAHLCIAALKRFFPSSPLVKPIIDELESLANQPHSIRSGDHASTVHTTVAAQESSSATARLSRAAKAKQRLAIHSLLGRGQFEQDDAGLSDSNNAIPIARASDSEQLRLDAGSPLRQSTIGTHQGQPLYSGDTPSPAHVDLAQITLYPWLHR